MNNESDTAYDDFEGLHGGDGKVSKHIPVEAVFHKRPRSKMWILTGILAGVCFGIANFFMGVTSEHAFYSQEIISIGAFLFGILYFGHMFWNDKSNEGHFWKWRMSMFYDSKIQSVHWQLVCITLALAVLLYFTGVLILLSFKYAVMSGINQGIISTLFALTSIYLALLFWYIYGQSMRIFDFIGMFGLVICTLMLIFSNHVDPTLYLFDNTEIISPAWSVLAAIACTLWFLIKCLLIKHSYEKLFIDPNDLIMAAFNVGGVVCLLLIVIDAFKNGIDSFYLTNNLLAGIFECLGNVLISHAIVTGIAGAASALANVQVILQVFLDLFLLRQYPTTFQVVACAIGMLGAIIIPVGPLVMEKIKK